MDFIISYQLYNNLKKKELSDELKELKEERSPIRESCSRCGQNPYLCQCQCGRQHECEKYSPTNIIDLTQKKTTIKY